MRLFTFQQGNANLVEMTLPADSPVVGTRVGDLDWPQDTVLVAIIRGERPIAPSRDDTLEAGDELMFVTVPECEDDLQLLLAPAAPDRCGGLPGRRAPRHLADHQPGEAGRQREQRDAQRHAAIQPSGRGPARQVERHLRRAGRTPNRPTHSQVRQRW